MKKLLLTLSTLFCTAFMAQAEIKVYYVELIDGQQTPANPIKEYAQGGEGAEKTTKLEVYPQMKFQTLEGMGGAFNEIGGVALMSLPEKDREEVMSNLFSAEGANFNYCRTAVGSSDFGVDAYSYSEVADDYEMEHFSIEREKTSVIPYIQLAIKNNPKMQLFGSPWSPPAWMKYSNLMDKGNTKPSENKLKSDPKIYKAYAKYFRKYVEAYAKEGITVNRIVVQNETDINTKYPSCFMPPAQMYELIKDYIRPEFKANNIEAEIWAGTFRTHGALHALEFAGNKEYLDAVDGLGVQYTLTRYLSDMNNLAKGKATMHTESVCYNGANSITQAKTRLQEVADYLNYDIPNFTYWNMILDQTKKSGWGWAQNSLININTETKEVTYNPDYAVMALLGRYATPGSVRIGAFTAKASISILDGEQRRIFVQNDTDEVASYVIFEDGSKIAQANIPAQSVAVIVY